MQISEITVMRGGTGFITIHLLVSSEANTERDLHLTRIICHADEHFWFTGSQNLSMAQRDFWAEFADCSLNT